MAADSPDVGEGEVVGSVDVVDDSSGALGRGKRAKVPSNGEASTMDAPLPVDVFMASASSGGGALTMDASPFLKNKVQFHLHCPLEFYSAQFQ